MSDILRLTAVRKTKTVEIEEQEGKFETYILMEMMGPDRKEYMYKSSEAIRVEDGKASGLGFKGQEIDLISRCLYQKSSTVNGGMLRVNADLVEKLLPSTAIGELFKVCQEINGLTKKDDEEAKND